jgi:hypothetical protein
VEFSMPAAPQPLKIRSVGAGEREAIQEFCKSLSARRVEITSTLF